MPRANTWEYELALLSVQIEAVLMLAQAHRAREERRIAARLRRNEAYVESLIDEFVNQVVSTR